MTKIVRNLSAIDNNGLEWRMCKQGVIISDRVLIAKSKSRWKKLGDPDWHSYYGLDALCKAIINNKLDEYADEQDFKNNRKIYATVVNNSRTRKTTMIDELNDMETEQDVAALEKNIALIQRKWAGLSDEDFHRLQGYYEDMIIYLVFKLAKIKEKNT
jgi:hypothetical protein